MYTILLTSDYSYPTDGLRTKTVSFNYYNLLYRKHTLYTHLLQEHFHINPLLPQCNTGIVLFVKFSDLIRTLRICTRT